MSNGTELGTSDIGATGSEAPATSAGTSSPEASSGAKRPVIPGAALGVVLDGLARRAATGERATIVREDRTTDTAIAFGPDPAGPGFVLRVTRGANAYGLAEAANRAEAEAFRAAQGRIEEGERHLEALKADFETVRADHGRGLRSAAEVAVAKGAYERSAAHVTAALAGDRELVGRRRDRRRVVRATEVRVVVEARTAAEFLASVQVEG